MEEGRDKDDVAVTTVEATSGDKGLDSPQEQSYKISKMIGSGSFGVVYQATLCATGETVAIKRVLQDKRFKNRELQIMRCLSHANIVQLRHFFYSADDSKEELHLNLVLEFIPVTLFSVIKHYRELRQCVPTSYVRLYAYQMFRGMAYMHSLGICHRDIKPQNLLVDPDVGVLKLCDFGSAKRLVQGDPNTSYICSRHYRAPELILGATNYDTKTDIWSAGCVLAEILQRQVLFRGRTGVDQFLEVIKVMGTPTAEQILEMNPTYTRFRFPQVNTRAWSAVFRERTAPDAVALVSRLLRYVPPTRITSMQACAHAFFDELRKPMARLPDGRALPPLFDFSEQELSIEPGLNAVLRPLHVCNGAASLDPAPEGERMCCSVWNQC